MRTLRLTALISFCLAILSILAAPIFLSDSYNPITNSISESAGQNVPFGWIGRTALLASGIGVLTVVALKRRGWSRTTIFSFTAFGVLWITTALFSTKSWVPNAEFNELESNLHSFAASAMAIVVLGALAEALSRKALSKPDRTLAFGLAAAATFLPLASLLWPTYGGLFQRVMFFFTYFWFARQALKS